MLICGCCTYSDFIMDVPVLTVGWLDPADLGGRVRALSIRRHPRNSPVIARLCLMARNLVRDRMLLHGTTIRVLHRWLLRTQASREHRKTSASPMPEVV